MGRTNRKEVGAPKEAALVGTVKGNFYEKVKGKAPQKAKNLGCTRISVVSGHFF